VDGKQVKGSPFQLNIGESSEPFPGMCYAEGSGIKDCTQYRRADFSVFLRDEKNNPVSKGNLNIFLKGTDQFQYSVVNSSLGSYWIRYKTTCDAGNYKLFVTVEGENIKGSPFYLTVEEGHQEDETSLNAGFPRLIRLSVVGKIVLTTLMPLSPYSLNQEDVFLLDNELTVYQWNGDNTSRVLKVSAGHIVKVLNYDRRSALQHKIIEDAYNGDIDSTTFWELLGITGNDLPKTFEGDPKDPGFIPKCLIVQDDESIEILAEGSAIKGDLLNEEKIIVLDTGFEVFTWEGKNCSNSQKRYAYQAGKDYVKQYKRPEGILVKHIIDGSENWTFKHFLNGDNIL